jgi:Fe-S-cluster-containing hydrogenase component 2
MSKTLTQIIELHSLAPLKPEFGARCNGCGACCAAEPCPVAFLFLFQFRRQCRALLWQNLTGRYVCGMVVCPDQYVRLIPKRLRNRMGKFFASRIATEVGCDFDAEFEVK